ncbi:MAG: hypothetical protein K9J83_05210 [Desulfarculaceae bacterium]|nr:hypothetical protein [Desulfarculaceae bacterium]
MKNFFSSIMSRIWRAYDYADTADRYKKLRRNIFITMLLVTILPLSLMAAINYHQYRQGLRQEIVKPLHNLVNKAAHSIDFFLKERRSAIEFISSIYSYEELLDSKTMNRLFLVLNKEFKGYVDLGLIDKNGYMVNYTGPYDLLGKEYSSHDWFQEVFVKGEYISNVFMGYRKIPHIAIAVRHLEESGSGWVLRATLGTEIFSDFIKSMGLGPNTDAFIINRKGVLQTYSKLYGSVLENCGLDIPYSVPGPTVQEITDSQGREFLAGYTPFLDNQFVLVVMKPKGLVMKSWVSLKSDMLIVFIIGVAAIVLIIFSITDRYVKRIKTSDERRMLAMKELEHHQQLSSIGRLAAGVAHEINNPLAIINENMGLLKDMIHYDRFDNGIFQKKVDIVIDSVERAKKITHRLLGFAKRIDVNYEMLDINEVLREVFSFVDKEILYKNIETSISLGDDLPFVSSDRGQLEQVFLNILTNAMDAAGSHGKIDVTTEACEESMVRITIRDNGPGISRKDIDHIFDPFFTTKKEKGTGLGLSITYGIIKKLGGEIKVESEEGQGAAFMIYLCHQKSRGSDEKFTCVTS